VSRLLDEIRTLDPVRDAQRIVFIDACLEFPWDTQRSLELAFYRTYAVPSIAELLASTGEFTERAQKRYDDTQILLSAFCEHGYDAGLGRRAIKRMNRIHGRFAIANEDFLYVLSTLVFEPIRWNGRFGWRPLIDNERIATFHFWGEVGKLMGIRDIPEDYESFERFNVEFERDHFAYTDAGNRVAAATRDMFVAWFLACRRQSAVRSCMRSSTSRYSMHSASDIRHAACGPPLKRPCTRGRARSVFSRRVASRACERRSGIAATGSTGRSSGSARRRRILRRTRR